ncbi:ATP-binding protein [Mycetohabitans sp. B3]|nr:ATP-binding protein [Mycetohabitans sp. B3]MCF2134591.1 ATP-binding protein [Mycetohabitans sp. B3]
MKNDLPGLNIPTDVMSLLSHVERLDLLLQRRLQTLEQHPDDRLMLHALMLSPEALAERLERPTGVPAWFVPSHETMPPPPPTTGRLAQVVARFGLSDLERDLLILSLLPRLDSRYGALLAYAQQDEARRWPTLDWALSLLCPDNQTRLAQQARLGADAPLFAHGLVRRPKTGEVLQDLKINPSVYYYLIGGDVALPARCADWLTPVAGAHAPDFIAALARDWRMPDTISPVVAVKGEGGGAALAEAAASVGRRALQLNLASLPDEDDDAWAVLDQVLREARLWDLCLVLAASDVLADTRPRLFAPFARQIAAYPAPVAVLVTSQPVWLGARAQVFHDMPPRSMAHDVKWLREQLAPWTKASEVAKLDLDTLVQRFRPTPETATHTLQEADGYRRQRGQEAVLEMADLTKAFGLRAQRQFGSLAQRLTPKRNWDDLMLPDDVQHQLREVRAAIHHRENVLERGFARKLGNNTGISALFYGDSGTGKTLAAEVLAGELGVDLIRVDLSTVVNKYIGETEKHLARIFDLAAADSGILFFDEADALFGKRSEVKDAQDRHANIEVAYLLQRLEAYPGLVILSTNHRAHLDDAFTRRLTFMIRFTFPNAAVRERMWRAIWPAAIALANDVDLTRLARQAEITGGNIRNIALFATWLAVDEGAPCVGRVHLERAAQRELGKMGRLWARDDN